MSINAARYAIFQKNKETNIFKHKKNIKKNNNRNLLFLRNDL